MTHFLEVLNLTPIFLALGWAGAFLAVILMQVVWHNEEERQVAEPRFLRWLNRLALTALSLCLAWAMNYAALKNWQPWPPVVILMVALDSYFLIGIVTVRIRTIHRRSGQPPSIKVVDALNKRMSAG